MSEKKITVRPGGRVRIELPASAADTATSDDGGQGASLLAIDDDPSRYAFRTQTRLALYDLGTRLRSVPPASFGPLRSRDPDSHESPTPQDGYFNEYVEIGFSWEVPDPIASTAGGTVTLPDSAHAEYTRGLLGPLLPTAPGDEPDPVSPVGTSSANVTGRALANVAQAPWDLVTVTIGGRVIETEKWEPREPRPADEDERWNPQNLAGTESPVPAEYSAEVKGLSGTVRVEPLITLAQFGLAYAFRGFDTGDADNFKATREPLYDAPAVSGRFSGRSLSIYLVPELRAGQVGNVVELGAEGYDGQSRVGRLYAYYAPSIGCVLRRLFGESLALPGYNTPELANPAPAGSLAAVLRSGSGVRYVWRTTDAGPGLSDNNPRSLPACDG